MSGLKELLVQYSIDVINSKQGHCQKEKWACMRFLRDIERENTDEFPYVFDEEKALRFLRWMTNFKHSKGVLAGQNILFKYSILGIYTVGCIETLTIDGLGFHIGR